MSTGVFPSPQALSNLQNLLQTLNTGQTYTLGNTIGSFLTKLDLSGWELMNTNIQSFITQTTAGINNYPNLRVVITLTDGTVAYDSGVSGNVTAGGVVVLRNSFQAYQSKLINENHNSRIAIMTALLSKLGTGYEIKYSSSTGRKEAYNAIRMGVSADDALGCCRVSYQYTA